MIFAYMIGVACILVGLVPPINVGLGILGTAVLILTAMCDDNVTPQG